MTLVLPAGKARATRWRSIADTLAREIRDGVLQPGSALPNVLGLAARFGVNRHTVRQALQHLQQHGLVSVEQGRGTFVRAPRLDYQLGRRVRFSTSLRGAGHGAMQVLAVRREPVGPAEAESLRLEPGSPCWTFRLRRMVDGRPLSTSFHVLEWARFPGFETALRDTLSVSAALAECGVPDYVRLATHVAAVLPGEDERRPGARRGRARAADARRRRAALGRAVPPQRDGLRGEPRRARRRRRGPGGPARISGNTDFWRGPSRRLRRTANALI
jgi:GntR family phosphonate transport system transcriptional regulator